MKINIPIHIFLILSFSFTVSAQDCLQEGITFSTQKQIDNFPTNYPDCTKIKGDVRIEERKSNAITNLNSLSQITSIEGNLIVSNNKELNSLKGLNNLTNIGGQLGIWGNSSLVNLTGLENLNSINGHLTISKNNSLWNLEGLNKLITIGGFFRVKENNSITSLSGLDQLFSIGKDLWVHSNDNLKSIEGLENLTSIKGNLLVTENKILKNLNGLNNLVFIGKSLKIRNNDSLVSLSVLNNVSSIGGRIEITNNASLVYKNELDKLSSSSKEEIKSAKENLITNKNVKYANDDPKWEFGVVAGFASVKMSNPHNGILNIFGPQITIRQSDKEGFRIGGTAKYNINDRFQSIGGFGIVHAKGNANIKKVDSEGFRSPIIRTTINEEVIQNYTLLQIPVYLRFHLFGKRKAISDNFNIFFDFGGSFDLPLINKSSFIINEGVSTTVNTYVATGWFSSELVDSETTTVNMQKQGDLKLQSFFNGYFAFGFLVGDRASIAFSYSGINTQGIQDRSVKFNSSLNSVAVTVFF